MKKYLLLPVLSVLILQTVHSQTNVSGGIFSSTTWTLATSPYIVIDTVVVFPGVTLTIEPGVTVKFDDNMYLEIRQAALIANGTITDSITFTSNSLSPTPGIWGHTSNGGLWLNGSMAASHFNFCNVSYATKGIRDVEHIKNSTFTNNETGIYNLGQSPVDSCVFRFNVVGISDIGNATLNFCTISDNYLGVEYVNGALLNNCTFDSNHLAFGGATGATYNGKFHYCSISHNQSGLHANGIGGNLLSHCMINFNSLEGIYFGLAPLGADSIIDCEIKYNGLGVGVNSNTLITRCDIEYDTIGIKINNPAANIYCNKICNNVSYGLQMSTSANFNVADNYWCTTDSAQVAAAIYDGYDNVSFGLVTFLPLDSTCYVSTSINEIENNSFITIYPNPFSSEAIVQYGRNLKDAVITVYNLYGRQVKQINHISGQTIILSRDHLPGGLYFIHLAEDNKTLAANKIVITD